MLILLDNGAPRGLTRVFVGHIVEEARLHGWEELANGELLEAAELAGFEVLVTTDKNIRYQQNLTGRKISLVVLGNSQWPMVKLVVEEIVSAINSATPGSYIEIKIPFKSK